MNNLLFRIQLFIRFTTLHVFRGRLSKNFVRPSFPFGIECRMKDVVVLIPDHSLSSYFRTMKAY